MTDRYEKLKGAQRWFFDGLSILNRSDFFASEEVDMTATQQLIAQLRQQGIQGTYTHVVVRATALALARHPEFNRLLLRKRLVYPDTVDISLSVNTGLAAAFPPSFVIRDAGQKTLELLAQEIIQGAEETRERGTGKRRPVVRKTARLIPASWMRRGILRLMMSRLSVIKQRAGTFHVTCIPHQHQGVPFTLSTPAVLSFARVEERVVAREGQAVVRPIAIFGMAGDGRLWNGNSVAILLNEIKTILQEGQLACELRSVEVGTAVP
jgi:pyruvate/2-oxoglutarate dehydrogenase complex dihydrolipoamide acyltransferase (E2) component